MPESSHEVVGRNKGLHLPRSPAAMEAPLHMARCCVNTGSCPA